MKHINIFGKRREFNLLRFSLNNYPHNVVSTTFHNSYCYGPLEVLYLKDKNSDNSNVLYVLSQLKWKFV